MGPLDEPRSLPAWLLAERARSLLSVAITLVLTTGTVTATMFLVAGLRPVAPVLGTIVGWAVFAATHSVLTWAAFRRLQGDRLRQAVTEQPVRRRRRIPAPRRRPARVTRPEAPDWSVQISILALVSVGALVVVPGLRQQPAVLGAALAMVVASWVNMSMVYAVDYARIDAAHGGLAFPGDDELSFSDYRYLALALQTTFGTTDVELRTSLVRRVAMTHGVVAFVFNSVIVALIVSLLLGIT